METIGHFGFVGEIITYELVLCVNIRMAFGVRFLKKTKIYLRCSV